MRVELNKHAIICGLIALLCCALTSSRAQQSTDLATSAPKASQVACVDNSKMPSELPPPGPRCAEQEFATKGKPEMAPAEQGIAYGVSVPPGQSGRVNVLMDNETDQAETYYMCCRLTFQFRFDIFDSSGRLVLSEQEKPALKSCVSSGAEGWSCSCSAMISVPPHTMQTVDAGDISDGYALSPGVYFLLPANRDISDCDSLVKLPSSRPLSELTHAIRFTVP